MILIIILLELDIILIKIIFDLFEENNNNLVKSISKTQDIESSILHIRFILKNFI